MRYQSIMGLSHTSVSCVTTAIKLRRISVKILTLTSKQMFSRDSLEDVAKEKGHQILEAIEKSARTTFPILNDYEGNWLPKSPYSVVRHTRSLVYYQGVSTVVPITILGEIPVPPTRRIKLQRRGMRTGMFGWTGGTLLGGKLGKEIDVTPQSSGNWEEDITVERRKKFDKHVKRFLDQDSSPKTHAVQETDFVRIPVSSGDGYFRIVVYPTPSSRSIIAATGVFRLGSLSPHSSSLRGASLGTMTSELVLKSASSTIGSTVQSAVYAAVPLAQAYATIPGTKKMSGKALDSGYRHVAGSETQAQYHSINDVGHHVQDRVHNFLPLENIGVRTGRDLREDQRIGVGGVSYRRYIRSSEERIIEPD